MDFYGIVKKIDELKKELEQTTLSAIEKDIIKSKISEAYLLLFEKQRVEKQEVTPEKQDMAPEKQDVALEKQEIEPSPTAESSPLPPPPLQKEPIVEESSPKKPLNVDYKSLVDAFLEKEPPAKQPFPEEQSLLSKISHTKIVDLKRSIAMNDRFIFIKELFNNDFDAYNRSINDLNGCENMQQADQYLVQLKQQYEWDEENETAQYFITLIARKFC